MAIKVMQFNVENLFLYLDQHDGSPIGKITEREWQAKTSSPTPNKSLQKTWAIAAAIEDVNPDFILLNEVGGLESLQNLNKYFLQNHYSEYLIEGNSDRGIDVGYLVNKNLSLKCLNLSHKNRVLKFTSPQQMEKLPKRYHYFARDVSELRIFRPQQNSPELILLLVHLKSKLDPEGLDPSGRLRREAEVNSLAEIYREIQSELSSKVPVILAGDFNGRVQRIDGEPEFASLFHSTDLLDVFEEASLPSEKRFTQLQMLEGGECRFLQLDYIFVSPDLSAHIDKEKTGPYRFKGDLGFELPIPTNLEQRYALPSDHYPTVLTLNLKNW